MVTSNHGIGSGCGGKRGGDCFASLVCGVVVVVVAAFFSGSCAFFSSSAFFFSSACFFCFSHFACCASICSVSWTRSWRHLLMKKLVRDVGLPLSYFICILISPPSSELSWIGPILTFFTGINVVGDATGPSGTAGDTDGAACAVAFALASSGNFGVMGTDASVLPKGGEVSRAPTTVRSSSASKRPVNFCSSNVVMVAATKAQ